MGVKPARAEVGEAGVVGVVEERETTSPGAAASRSAWMRALKVSAMGLWERSQKCVKGKSARQCRQMKRSRSPRGRRQTTHRRGIVRSSNAVPMSRMERVEIVGSIDSFASLGMTKEVIRNGKRAAESDRESSGMTEGRRE